MQNGNRSRDIAGLLHAQKRGHEGLEGRAIPQVDSHNASTIDGVVRGLNAFNHRVRNAAGTAFTSSVAMVNGTAEYDFDQMIHQIHMGSNLLMGGHDIAPDNTPQPAGAVMVAGEGEYAINFPQNAINCSACHVASTATPQAGNWATTPSRAACGGCHDNVNFLTGVNHTGVIAADETGCAGCHTAADIQVYHTPLMNPHENGTDTAPSYNPTAQLTKNWQATNQSSLPAGAATITYKIVSATLNATGNPVLQFQILANGSPLTLNTYVAGTTAANAEVLPTPYAAGPNISLTMGIPQDGIAPTDFNYGHQDTGAWGLRAIWNGTAMAGKTAKTIKLASAGITTTSTAGTYQIVMDGIIVPTDTKLVALAIGTAGVVQTNLTPDPLLSLRMGGAPNFAWTAAASATTQGTGGVLLPAMTVWAQATGKNPNTTDGKGVTLITRRTIIDPAKCNTCHQNLGAFTSNNTTEAQFHDNYMNNGASCIFCHYTNGTSTGFSYNAKTWVHGLHAAGMRSNPYNIQTNFPGIIYPGKLNDCEACHVPGSYDFSNTTNAGQIPGMLWDTVATGTFTTGPWVNYTLNYGSAASFVAPVAASAAWPSVTTGLPVDYAKSAVSSPLTAACAACHDTSTAVSHMTNNGGVWYSQRQNVPTLVNGSFTGAQGASIVLQSNEQCLICHGSGAVADIKAVHMNF